MKKIGFILGAAVLGLFLAACNNNTNEEELTSLSIICPSGTPSLALANYKVAHEDVKFEIVEGSDPLVAAFGSKSHEIIVAPVNLGAKFYNTNENYVLAKTFVWGNLFLASKSDLTSFDDVDGKKLVVFSQGSTPDIITQILIKENNLNVELDYVSNVKEANTALVSGKADYVITAEPAISKIKDAQGIKTVDLQAEYAKVTGTSSYPQAGIFVKKDVKDDKLVKDTVNQLLDSVTNTVSNPDSSADNAVLVSETFKTLGKETLVKAIPNSHYQLLDKNDEKTAVNKYLQYLLDLGFAKQVGDKLPGEEFYL